jgi:hypothetical protein
MVAVVAGTTDARAFREVWHAASADERDVDIGPGRQTTQRSLGRRDDGGGPGVETKASQRAIEVTGQQQAPFEQGPHLLESVGRGRQTEAVRSQR